MRSGHAPAGAPSRQIEAVIFDVDGTIAETERDGHRVAFNLAFERLGLPYVWDEDLYGRLLAVRGGTRRLEHYLAGRSPPEERASLVPRLHELKNAFFIDLIRGGAIGARPGVVRLIDELDQEGVERAIATTGSRSWVGELLEVLLGPDRVASLATIVTGDEVACHKPDPEIYLMTLRRLGSDPGATLAIEDSELGLRAVKAAGLACVIVRNSYTVGQDFAGADLVVDGLGGQGSRHGWSPTPTARWVGS